MSARLPDEANDVQPTIGELEAGERVPSSAAKPTHRRRGKLLAGVALAAVAIAGGAFLVSPYNKVYPVPHLQASVNNGANNAARFAETTLVQSWRLRRPWRKSPFHRRHLPRATPTRRSRVIRKSPNSCCFIRVRQAGRPLGPALTGIRRKRRLIIRLRSQTRLLRPCHPALTRRAATFLASLDRSRRLRRKRQQRHRRQPR